MLREALEVEPKVFARYGRSLFILDQLRCLEVETDDGLWLEFGKERQESLTGMLRLL